MIYLKPAKKKGLSSADVIRGLVLLFILFVSFLFFGNVLTRGLHGVQRSVAYVFGYYDNPVRPVAESAYTTSLENENVELQNLLGRKQEKDDRILSVILSRPPKTPYDSLIIDIGENQGLVPGDLVYGEMDYLIGHIDAVYPTTSSVKLYSSPGEKIDVLIGSSSVPVVAEGRGSGNFYVKVPRNISLHEGDTIVVPSLHSIILGSAEKVDTGEGEAYAYIYFKLPVNLNSLKYVEIKKTVL